MSGLELWVSEYLLNSLWRVPLVFAAAWLAARMVRTFSVRVEHRIWVSALVLEAVLPAFRFDFSQLLVVVRRLLPWKWGGSVAGGYAHVSFGVGTASNVGVLGLAPPVLKVVVVLYAGCLFYFAARLMWGVWKTVAMRRTAKPVKLSGEFARLWERLNKSLAPARSVDSETIGVSQMISGPVTVGVTRQLLLVPDGFLEGVEESELEAVLAHELAHMQRRDFAKNVLYEALSVAVAYHPSLWTTRSRVAESREMVCDRMAAEALAGRERYVRSLLRLAAILSDRPPARILHAIGIFDANIFERRIMNLTKREKEVRGLWRVAIVAACVAIGAATCVSALALRMEVSGQTDQDKSPTALSVSANIMQGNLIYKKDPVYPAEAKANKDTVNGPVILLAIISKEGIPVKLLVKKSLRADYDQSAMDAVREWRWKPFLLNGEPTSVKTTITVNYQLAD
ncbi:MAG TPA: M56 family metallopeptidase [Edaphobacter sp.]|jgi:TonB family protein|nr:M56 family metallopeptidase [Edaphobacter sp.]